jgi:hypothetical protein
MELQWNNRHQMVIEDESGRDKRAAVAESPDLDVSLRNILS